MSGWGARRMMVITMEAFVVTPSKGRIVEIGKGRILGIVLRCCLDRGTINVADI